MRVQTLFVFVCGEPVCAISLGAHDLELPFANKRATSLPEDGEPEYKYGMISQNGINSAKWLI